MTSSQLEATQSNNVRRQVFYQYPNGQFPLMGLLSMAEEVETTDKQTFGWNEDREIIPKSNTVMANSDGPFTTTSGSAGAPGTDLTAAGFAFTVGTTYRMKVVDASLFRVRDVVWAKDLPGTSSSKRSFKAIVDVVYSAQNTVDIRITEAESGSVYLNTTAANGYQILAIGSASVEGGFSKLGGTRFPIELINYTQIFRTPVGPFSRNALKMGQKFDSSGIYKTTAKQAHIRHMTMLEQSAFWGSRGSNNVTDPDDGSTKVEKTTGGLLYFLNQWELGASATYNYRGAGASDITASAWDADDDKRILKFNGGTVTKKQFNSIIERAFFRTGDGQFEKLLICGTGFVSVFNEFAEKSSIKTININEKETTYGMSLTTWESPFGTLMIKTHPLFTENPAFRYSAFIVDMGSVKYHAFQDSDTELLKNRQAPDFDGRKDEWLTEYGLEVNFPERHMFIDNLQGITV